MHPFQSFYYNAMPQNCYPHCNFYIPLPPAQNFAPFTACNTFIQPQFGLFLGHQVHGLPLGGYIADGSSLYNKVDTFAASYFNYSAPSFYNHPQRTRPISWTPPPERTVDSNRLIPRSKTASPPFVVRRLPPTNERFFPNLQSEEEKKQWLIDMPQIIKDLQATPSYFDAVLPQIHTCLPQKATGQ